VRIYNVAGRLTLGVGSDGGVDVETASGGWFPAAIQPIYESWDAFAGWAGPTTARRPSRSSGIGWARKPPLLLQIGDELVTWADGIGEMRHSFVAPLIDP